MEPLTQHLRAVIENATLQGILNVAAPANAQVCIVGTMTGPTQVILHIIRHRRASPLNRPTRGEPSAPSPLLRGLATGQYIHYNVEGERDSAWSRIRAGLPRKAALCTLATRLPEPSSTMFYVAKALNILSEDTELDFGSAALPRVAQYVHAPLNAGLPCFPLQ